MLNTFLSYENRFKKIKLPTLKYRQFKGDMIEVYKIIHTVTRHD